MNALLDHAWSWWSSGELLMPVMFAVAMALYTLLTERSLRLWGVRRARRAIELSDLLMQRGDHRWQAWAARYVAVAEAGHLSSGIGLIRALTACLPLLGLLGTVSGMVDTFGHLATTRQASAGIGLALATTQYGMALAIPAVLWEWALSRRAAQLVHHRETTLLAAIHGAETP